MCKASTFLDVRRKCNENLIGVLSQFFRCSLDLSNLKRDFSHDLWLELEDGAGKLHLLVTVSALSHFEAIDGAGLGGSGADVAGSTSSTIVGGSGGGGGSSASEAAATAASRRRKAEKRRKTCIDENVVKQYHVSRPESQLMLSAGLKS